MHLTRYKMILGIDCSDGLNLIFFDKKKILYTYKNLKVNNTSEIQITHPSHGLNKKCREIGKQK